MNLILMFSRTPGGGWGGTDVFRIHWAVASNFRVVRAKPGRGIGWTELVPDPLVGRFHFQVRVAVSAIGAIGRLCQTVELGFVVRLDESLTDDHSHHDPDREGAATEAKAEQIVACVAIIAAGEFIELDHVPSQPEAERTAKYR